MREQQTLGRRIQEARKAAGLSQESLGERLGVSRQAVSKWEADAAVPELENLIAMSRIFGVTIGALLGVEPEAAEDRSEKDAPEAPGEGVEGTAPAGELTDRELAAVEAIAKKYLDAAQVVQNPRWSRKKKIAVSAGICGAALTAALALGSGLSALGSRLDQVQSQVYGIESSVSGQIGALAGQIRDLLDEDSNLFAVSQARVTDYDLAAGTVTLQVSAQAKSWQDNTTALFTALPSDGRQFSAEASGKNGTFTAQNWTLPMDQEILLSASLTTDGVTAADQMETLYDCLPGNSAGCVGWVQPNRLGQPVERFPERFLAADQQETHAGRVVPFHLSWRQHPFQPLPVSGGDLLLPKSGDSPGIVRPRSGGLGSVGRGRVCGNV